MKIMISIKDAAEAKAVVEAGGVDIIDVKNPDEGTLGANHPWIIEEVRDLMPKRITLAASIGDLDYKPGGASLAAYGASSLGVDLITAAMFMLRPHEVEDMVKTISKAAKENGAGLIVAGYADYIRCGSVNPFEFLPHVIEGDYIMLDTYLKDGKNILDFACPEDLMKFREEVTEQGYKLIVAGSLRYPQLEIIKDIKPDVLGFRGIVCEDSRVKKELVQMLLKEFV